MTTFPDSIWNFFPHWLAGALAILLVLVYVLSKFGVSHEVFTRVGAWFTRLFQRSRKKSDDVDYQIADLWRQVKFLEQQLAELRLRDEMYWAWILKDQEWHRQHEFAAAERGWETIPHQSFMEFRDEWVAKRATRPIKITRQGDLPF